MSSIYYFNRTPTIILSRIKKDTVLLTFTFLFIFYDADDTSTEININRASATHESPLFTLGTPDAVTFLNIWEFSAVLKEIIVTPGALRTIPLSLITGTESEIRVLEFTEALFISIHKNRSSLSTELFFVTDTFPLIF